MRNEMIQRFEHGQTTSNDRLIVNFVSHPFILRYLHRRDNFFSWPW